MKLNSYLAVIFLILSLNINAQANQSWLNSYSINNEGGFPTKTLSDANGNTYSCGTFYIDPVTYFSVPSVVKYGPDGSLLWVAEYQSPTNSLNYFYDLKIDDQGNVYACGSHAEDDQTNSVDLLTCKFSNSGSLLWASTFNGSGDFLEEGYFITLDQFGNVYCNATGNYDWNSSNSFQNSNCVTVKYNSSGTLLWSNVYDTPNREDAGSTNQSVVVDNDQNVFVVGRTSSTSLSEMFVVKYDVAGVQEWVKLFSGVFENVGLAIDTLNQALYIEDWTAPAFNAEIHKISTNDGANIWSVSYHGSESNSVGVDFEIMSDLVLDETNVYLAFTQRGINQNDDKYKLVKFSKLNGSVIWTASYHEDLNENYSTDPEAAGASFTKGLVKASNGSFYILGWGLAIDESSNVISSYDIIEVSSEGEIGCHFKELNGIPYSITTDDLGNVFVGSSLTIGENSFFSVGKYENWNSCFSSINTIEGSFNLVMFPNPVKDLLRIKADETIQLLTIVNNLGQKILSLDVNSKSAELDLAGLTSGSYFVEFQTMNSVKSVKFVKD